MVDNTEIDKTTPNRKKQKSSGSLEKLLTDGVSLSAIVHGLPVFGQTFLDIFRNRRRFIHDRPREPKIMLKDSFVFLLYGIFVSFLLIVPSMIISGVTIGKWSFLIETLVLYSYFGSLFHFSCKIARGRGTFQETIACYFYCGGATVFLYIVCMYPLFLLVGPSIIFERQVSELYLHVMESISQTEAFVILFGFITINIISLMLGYIMFGWLSHVHAVSAKRLFGFSLLITLPGYLVHFYFLAPMSHRVTHFLEKVLRAL